MNRRFFIQSGILAAASVGLHSPFRVFALPERVSSIKFEHSGIRLREDWKFYFKEFNPVIRFTHSDECMYSVFHSYDGSHPEVDWCVCTPKARKILLARWCAYPAHSRDTPRLQYYQISVTEEIDEVAEALGLAQKDNCDWSICQILNAAIVANEAPTLIKEDFDNAMTSLYYYLRFNEVTGQVLNDILEPELNGIRINHRELDRIVYS